jgi:hypothetical protein
VFSTLMRRTLLALSLLTVLPPAAADAGYAGSNGQIAYVGKLGGQSALIVRSGKVVRTVTDGGRLQGAAWSPLGRRLVFTRGGSVQVVDHDGRGLRQVTTTTDARDPVWSPGGSEIAFSSGGKIVSVPAEGGAARTLATGKDPAWTPRAAISYTRAGNVYVTSGGRERRLVKRGTSPAWSPEGKRLAFVRRGALYVARSDGKGARRVARGPLTAPNFSPDGSRVLYSTGRPGRRRILSVRATGGGLLALSATTSDGRTPDWQPVGFDPVIAAAGDIACDPEGRYYNGGVGVPARCGQLRTSNLLLRQDLWQILPLGDNQYQNGELSDFMAVYDVTWGRTKHLQRPVIGNHEYSSGGFGYFDYFNGVGVDDGPAGSRQLGGYYAYDIGSWHVVALNSECDHVPGGCAEGSPQQQWLAAELAAHPARCTLAVWHTPRYSSYGGGAERLDALWDTFAAGGGDVVLSGHHHFYERMAPVDGVRQFIVGTGGGSIRNSEGGLSPYSQAKLETTFGILRMTLRDGGYDWRFLSASADPATDSGSADCR